MNEETRQLTSEFDRMREQMERMVTEFFVSKNPFIGVAEGVWRPPTDVYETPESVVIKVEIAGMNSKDIAVEVRDGRLIIHGNRRDQADSERVKYSQMEIKYTRFERVIHLPENCDEECISASYRDGFLEIMLPRNREERTRSRSIDVQVEEA